MHAEQTNKSNQGNNGLKRDIVTREDKQIHYVNVLIPYLKLQPLHDLIELKLMAFQLFSRLQLELGVDESQVIVRIDYFNQRRDEGVSDC